MRALDPIDVTTDFQEDAGGRDPDLHSPLLQEFHRRLWCRPLPNGEVFELIPTRVNGMLALRYPRPEGAIVLSSDTLANSNRGALRSFYDAMGRESNTKWHSEGGTIGGRILFPRNRIHGKQTINQLRGTHPRIRDRFDLTLEAIRRHYLGEGSPLAMVLARYADFFALFESFENYVEFFLLQNLVTANGTVKFYLEFQDYSGRVLPSTFEEYVTFRQHQLAFVSTRNRRIIELTSD